MKTYSRKNSSYLKKAFVASNFNEMCRLCLSEVDLVLTPIIQDYKTSYQEWIHYSVDILIEEGDGLPPNICEECLAMVEQTYLFKKKCKASDAKLREHLELLEMNEEGKINDRSFNDLAEDHKNLFTKEHPNETKCSESSAVDSGGTSDSLEKGKYQEIQLEGKSTSKIFKTNKKFKNSKELEEEDEEEEEEEEEEKEKEDEEEEKENEEKEYSEKEKQETIVKDCTVSEPKSKKVIKQIQRYILKGEKRDGDQEEDLTVCEVVPLEVKHDMNTLDESESMTYTSFDCKDQNGGVSVGEKLGGRIQEIYQLWENEEDGEEMQEIEKSENIIMNAPLEKEKNSKNEGVGVIELDMEENGFVQTHRVYTNKYQIAIVETIPQKKTFKCFACESEFHTSVDLKSHIGKAHREVSDAAYCDTCGKSFTCSNSLKRHMAIHTGFKPYKCDTCGREFSQGSILKRHVLTHETLKPFNCHLCNKGYTQKMNLLSHLRSHGFRTGAESFQCKLCSKSFVHQSGLSRHLKLHKGVRFLCVHCKKSFGDASALARHVKSIHQQI